ncbi:MAG: ribonuclease P protein component [Puniceicoccaceae bacterium]
MHFGWQTRLARSSEINRVFKEGKRHNCGVFLLIAAERSPEARVERTPRLCVIVSKRISKRAPDRNLLKRRFRALYREYHELLPDHLDLILIARQGMLTTPYAELQQRFKKACAKLKGI